MKTLVFCWSMLMLTFSAPTSHARSCSDESSERKQAFKAGSDPFEASIASETYEKQRELRKARYAEFEASDRGAFKECMERNKQTFDAGQASSERCMKDMESKVKANWARVEEYQSQRPRLPDASEGKEAFADYQKKMVQYRDGLESLRAEVKKQNQELISGSCRAGSSGGK